MARSEPHSQEARKEKQVENQPRALSAPAEYVEVAGSIFDPGRAWLGTESRERDLRVAGSREYAGLASPLSPLGRAEAPGGRD